VDVNPLLPAGTWDWFGLDDVRDHGRALTILWDCDGRRYGRGAGLSVWANGIRIADTSDLRHLTGALP